MGRFSQATLHQCVPLARDQFMFRLKSCSLFTFFTSGELPLKNILHGFWCPNKGHFYRNGYFQ